MMSQQLFAHFDYFTRKIVERLRLFCLCCLVIKCSKCLVLLEFNTVIKIKCFIYYTCVFYDADSESEVRLRGHP